MLTTSRVGEGPRTTLLLHGFLGAGRNLSSLARRWADRDPSRTFVLVDLPGHGSSPPIGPDTTLATMASSVIETADALGLPAGIEVTGHSLGGRVGLAMADAAPERVGALTLLDIGPGPIPRPESESAKVLDVLVHAPRRSRSREVFRQALLEGGLSRPLTEWVLTNLRPDGDDYVWRIDVDALAQLSPRIMNTDLWNVVERRDRTIFCVRGGRSGYLTADDVRRFESLGVQVTTLEGAGHFVHVDAPEALVAVLAAR